MRLLIGRVISSIKSSEALAQLCEEKICYYVGVTGSLQCEEPIFVAQNSPTDLDQLRCAQTKSPAEQIEDAGV